MKRNALAIVLLALSACSPLPHEPGTPTADGEEQPTEKIQSALLHSNLTSPYGTAPVNIYLGVIQNDYREWAIYQRKSDSNCTFYQVSNDDWLRGAIYVYGSSGNDRITLPAYGQAFGVTCSNYAGAWTFGSVQQMADSTIDVYGGDGDDEILCTGDSSLGAYYPARCMGEGGNDHLWSWSTSVYMSGGPGNDTILEYAAGPNLAIYGDDGDDCISTPGQTSAYQGGNGYDKSTQYKCSSCEQLVSSCP